MATLKEILKSGSSSQVSSSKKSDEVSTHVGIDSKIPCAVYLVGGSRPPRCMN